MRLSRLLAMTILLINRRRVTAPELAERFGVTVRTIYRDIEALREADIPVVGCQGIDGGFMLNNNYRLTRQMLTFEDIVSILTTLKGINSTLKNSDLDNVIEKIGCMIPEEREEEFNRKQELIAFDINPWQFNQQPQLHLDTLHTAASAQKLVTFSYTDYNSSRSSRTVEPMTLVFKSGAWYLFGYCRVRSDYRLFRLSRIRELTVTHERFTRRIGTYHDIAPEEPRSRNPVTLHLRFTPKMCIRIEDSFSPEQCEYRDDDTIDVRFTVEYDEWIYSWFLSFGSDCEVLEPRFIRKELGVRLKNLCGKYR